MITRRALLQGAGGLLLGATGLASYAVAVEPGFMLDVTRYRIAPRAWPAGLDLRVAIIALGLAMSAYYFAKVYL